MARGYRADLQQEREELAKLLEMREALETRIAKQRVRVAALATLAGENEEIGGLTESIRTVLRSVAGRALKPVEVRDRIQRLGFPVDEYSNILASVHVVLKRLAESG